MRLHCDGEVRFEEYTFFAPNTLSGCGLAIHDGLFYNGIYQASSINMDPSACSRATEIIVILTISNNGNKKEIRFLCDGKESDSADGSEHLSGDFLFPVVILSCGNAQITTITVHQIQIRTPEIEQLTKDFRLHQFVFDSVSQLVELQRVFLQQQEVHIRALIAIMKF